MSETVEEFKDKLRVLREEMYSKGDRADSKLVASWLNQLILALDGLSDSIELHGTQLELLADNEECASAGSEECCVCCMPQEVKKMPTKKKAVKKKAVTAKKPAAKKRR